MIPGVVASSHARAVAPASGVTWSETEREPSLILSEDRKQVTRPGTSGSQQRGVRCNVARTSGKVYFEVEITNAPSTTSFAVGVADMSAPLSMNSIGTAANYLVYRVRNGQVFAGTTFVGSFPSLVNGDRLGAAIDLDTRRLWFLKNGVSVRGSPLTDTNPFTNLAAGDLRPIAYMEVSSSVVALVAPLYMPAGFSDWGEP